MELTLELISFVCGVSGTGVNTGPDTSGAPGGVVIVSSNSYKINGVPSPVPGMSFCLRIP